MLAVVVALAALLPGGEVFPPPAFAFALERGLVAAPESLAAEVGAGILRRGGNAVDAAVAVHFALAVTFPNAGNLGGGGFLLVHTDSGEVAIDYRETAPAAAGRDMYLDAAGGVIEGLSLNTRQAAGLPGSVAGMWVAHRRFGTLPWRDLLAPAIRLAERGWRLHPWTARTFAEETRNNFRDYFHGAAGDLFVQRELAATLRRIAERGRDGFYGGETARLLAAEMRRGGGRVTAADLARYEPRLREPVIGTYRGCRVVSMPPPSSGGVALVGLLHMLEGFRPDSLGHDSAAYVSLVAEMESRVFADRAEYLGDPDFVAVPGDTLVSRTYAAARASHLIPGHRTPPDSVRAGVILPESEQTTHFSIVDRHGNAVACTTTLNDRYGSGIVVRGAGFLLNNEMDDFSARPGAPNLYGVTGGAANAIAPGKRMLSSMTPTFVFRGERLWLVLGSPGGPTIFTTVF
jgi:gamma-glutamyltranspeptidase/glutathione hydrolase